MYDTKGFVLAVLALITGVVGVTLMMAGMTSTQALPIALGTVAGGAVSLFAIAHLARFTIRRVRGI